MAKKKVEFSFEVSLQQIKAIADQLQTGNLHLEENMKLFQEAEVLIKACRQYLQETSVQVEQLVNPDNDERKPFV